MQMWEMVQQGRVMRSCTDYIVGYDCQIFRNVAIWYPRHNSDHFMVMGFLRGASPREQLRYARRRTCFLLQLPGRQTRT